MPLRHVQNEAIKKFYDHFKCQHSVIAYAPGRVEVLQPHGLQ